MKVYALLFTRGHAASFDYEIFAATHAGSLEMACRKFRVKPVTEESRGRWDRATISHRLPLPPKSENPEFVQVEATEKSASEVGHILSIPRHFDHMINVGAWVCELPVID